MKTTVKEQIEKLQAKQYQILEDAIKNEVKIILKDHKHLVSYIDIMGCSYFKDKNGENVNLIESHINSSYDDYYLPTFKYFKKLLDLYSLIPDFCLGEEISIN